MRKSVALLASVALAVLLACGVAWAAAGDLDPTFGDGDGQVVTDLGCESNVADLAVLPGSGKIVAYGSCTRDDPGSALVRYNPDGSVDPTFGGGDGVVEFGTLESDDVLRTVDVSANLVVQPDGRLLVGGRLRSYETHKPGFAVARFLPDGTLDTSFGGGDAKATAANLRGFSGVNDLAVVPASGDLMIASDRYVEYDYDFSLVRFRPNGVLDKSFGGATAWR